MRSREEKRSFETRLKIKLKTFFQIVIRFQFKTHLLAMLSSREPKKKNTPNSNIFSEKQ